MVEALGKPKSTFKNRSNKELLNLIKRASAELASREAK
jgi:hypothetical protein